jgi:hypothetical protein
VDGYLYVSIPDGSLRTLLKKIEWSAQKFGTVVWVL